MIIKRKERKKSATETNILCHKRTQSMKIVIKTKYISIST